MQERLGIDIGSTFITVFSQNKNKVVFRFRHSGKIAESLKKIFAETDNDTLVRFTGKTAAEFSGVVKDLCISEAEAINAELKKEKFFGGSDFAIISIGASSLKKYTIKSGTISDISSNSLCASGTGLFLEEQAERLSIDLENMPALDIAEPPSIASRCTVFAKSDLIHHQQEGRTKDEMWAGMCRALVISATNTLFKGLEIKGNFLLIGGVSLNKEVVRWFRTLFPTSEWLVPEFSEAFVAKGAAESACIKVTEIDPDKFSHSAAFEKMPPLTLKKSIYPQFTEPRLDEDNNEIRIHKSNYREIPEAILGMDIGSTSTKIALLDLKGEPILDIYRKTGGDPVNSAKKLFKALYSLIDPAKTTIRAFGTTGSGRKLSGIIFGADAIINEITAHAKGTASIFPEVETIFEIGGQDAKFIRLSHGFVTDVNMNYVCAAGTGSFVEEQARKLGIPINLAGKLTEHVAPPVTSDRCTVFMEQDIRSLLQQGFDKNEVLAAVHYSVVKNYLNRVVGNRKISKDKIFFQGATARNKGLVAAFENLLNVEMVVSPFCHVMGCIGAALVAFEEVKAEGVAKKSAFRGAESATIEVTSRTETCKLCSNFCRINHISEKGGRESSWGYGCGRDPETPVRKEIKEFELIKHRNTSFFKNFLTEKEPIGKVGLPLAVSTWTFLPLWKKMLSLLNIETVVSALSTTPAIKGLSSKYSASDFCFPVKTSIGHTLELTNKNLPVFFPTLISAGDNVKTAISFFCPYVQSDPSIISTVMEKNGLDPKSKIIDPVIDFRMSDDKNGSLIFKALEPFFPSLKEKQVRKAWKEARDYYKSETTRLIDEGEALLKNAQKEKKPVFLLVGRPYNLYDKGINLGIPETIAGMGFDILPIDMMKINVGSLADTNYWNLFWNYGQKIIAAIKRAKKEENVFPIYLTNFSCGPDSFILSFAENEMKGRPMLILELDEHSSDGGYLTRIEAFIDVVKGYMKNRPEPTERPLPDIYLADKGLKPGKIWIPPMHFGSPLFAAAFRAFGYDAQAIPLETKHDLVTGKKYVRGQECLPMILTLGSFLNQVKKEPGKQHTFFMPSSEGPCRLGQYNMLERIAFEHLGLDNIDILAPSSINSYQGVEEQLRRYLMHSVITSDVLMKMTTRTRPYEKTKGDVDTFLEKAMKTLELVFEQKKNPLPIVEQLADELAKIPRYNEKKPLVGIVGEIYVRSNACANGDLIRVIEENGGEAWLAPLFEWLIYTVWVQDFMAKQKAFSLFGRGESLIKNLYVSHIDESYGKAADKILSDRHEPSIKETLDEGMKYLHPEFVGEAILTVGRAVMFAKQGASMIVNVAPFGCMHGTITDSIFQEIKNTYNIPIVSQFYDGDIDINDRVANILRMRK